MDNKNYTYCLVEADGLEHIIDMNDKLEALTRRHGLDYHCAYVSMRRDSVITINDSKYRIEKVYIGE